MAGRDDFEESDLGKHLTENDWKAAIKKFRASDVIVADNGLGKALATFEKLGDDAYAERLKALAEIVPIATKLKTTLADGLKVAKAQKAKPEVIKNLTAAVEHLTALLDEANAEQAKAKAASDKAAAEEKKRGEADEAKRPVLGRLVEAAKTISGAPGTRLQKVMAIAEKLGSPGYKQLWHYNSYAVFQFVKYDQKASVREQMIKEGGGKLPFKGPTWVVYPFEKKLSMHCPPGCADKNLLTFLKSLDDDIQNSLDPMFKAQGTEVASAFGEQVNEFIKHVGKLAGDKGHLYSAY
jgi:hypothetical protein